MKLSSGRVAFPIEFDNGDTATIYFNPHDRGFQTRVRDFESKVNAKIKEIDFSKYESVFGDKKIEIDIDNLDSLFSASSEDLEEMQTRLNAVDAIEKEYNAAVKSELDEVFQAEISKSVFRYCEPFDTVTAPDENGIEHSEVYIVHFMRWLAVELRKYGAKNQQAIDKHIGKYKR